MSREEFRAPTPWSFFLPVALAVMLGVLVANALGATLFGASDRAVMVRTDAATDQAVATPAAAAADADTRTPTASAARPPATPDATGATAPAIEAVHLPGPSSARRDGATRACIGGTIAVRAANGWEQETVDDAPARCVASSR